MRIIEVIMEATVPIGVNTVVGNHTEDPNIGKGDKKTIAPNLTHPAEAKIITMAIIEAEVVVAMAETIQDSAVL